MSADKVPVSELTSRMIRFRARMTQMDPEWRLAVIFSKVNQYYFTGTLQDGMLLIPRDGEAVYWVRRSYDRALIESEFSGIRPMESYRDAVAGPLAATGPLAVVGAAVGTAAGSAAASSLPHVHFETEVVPMAMVQRFRKYFPFDEVRAADPALSAVRAVKSPWEQERMVRSGLIHRRVLEEQIPRFLTEGMSEADLAVVLFNCMMAEGYHGVSRFSMFDTDMSFGHIAFGENSIYPTSFNGPGGHVGLSPAAPVMGSRERKLRPGDLVFMDIGCGFAGYHTDKTMLYLYRGKLSPEAAAVHQTCKNIQDDIASRLRPGVTPAEIYRSVMERLDPGFQKGFMGYGKRQVKFLGHGIGLTVDELPVIAEGFLEPLEPGMAFAVEPKKGVAGTGLLGVENTFLVTPGEAQCLTGNSFGLIPVG
ncbi:MAG TPA: peptidase M24 [Clostridiales bacterium]|nr:peptidase M24 [Clostridiales bacterium]